MGTYPVRGTVNYFVSGHSLTDDPLAADIAAIAQSLGKLAGWNEQIVIGSPLRVRTSGNSNPPDLTWGGYRTGKNRNSSNMDVVSELRTGATLGTGQRYDSLLITERHDLLGPLQWEETVRFLRHYHELLNAGRSQSNSYFYQPWLSVSDKSSPQAWIDYERAASVVWQCVATRVNVALASENRSDRILSVPANWALAALVERAVRGEVAGISGNSATEIMNQLFTDDVHLTRLGSYFQSLVSYSALYGSSPVGAWAPTGSVSATQATSLQSLAWELVTSFGATQPPQTLAQCRTTMQNSFCSTHWTYQGRSDQVASCRTFFGGTTQSNPLFFEPTTNSSYWYPAPAP